MCYVYVYVLLLMFTKDVMAALHFRVVCDKADEPNSEPGAPSVLHSLMFSLL